MHSLFGVEGFVTRAAVGPWTNLLILEYVLSSTIICLSFFVISFSLIKIYIARRDRLPFHWLPLSICVLMMICGVTHFFGIVMFFYPMYRFLGALLVLAAAIALTTAICVVIFNKNLCKSIDDALDYPHQSKKLEDAQLAVSEAHHWRLIADTVPVIMWEANAAGEIYWYNKRWYDLTGLNQEDTFGWGWKLIVHPEDLSTVLSKWTEAIRTGKQYSFENRIKTKEGIYRWIKGEAVPIKSVNGSVMYWIGAGTDINEQKIKALESRYPELEELRELIGNKGGSGSSSSTGLITNEEGGESG